MALTNPFAAAVYWMPQIEAFFNYRLGSKRWTCYANRRFELPEAFERRHNETTEADFFNGFSLAQYQLAKHENVGIAINPIIAGLLYDPIAWVRFLSEIDNMESLFYFETPYDIYIEAVTTTTPSSPISEQEYDAVNERLIGYANRIIDQNWPGMH